MSLLRWLRLLIPGHKLAKRVPRRTARRRRADTRLTVEQLEGRVVPAFGLSKLRLGSSGLEDYLFTAGNKIVPVANVDAGKFYDLVVTDSNGVRHNSFAR